jgi:hypothetical protein
MSVVVCLVAIKYLQVLYRNKGRRLEFGKIEAEA